MKLYLTVDKDRKAFNGIVYPKVGEYVEAQEWSPDPEVECDKRLQGNSTNPNQGNCMELEDGRIFLEIEVEGDVVSNRDKDKYRFRKGKVMREWVIGKNTYKEIWQYLSGGNLFQAGMSWNLSQEIKKEGFRRLEGVWIGYARMFWKNTV